jgi:hypothetical protein
VSNPRKLGWQCVALRGLPVMLLAIGSLLICVPPAGAAFGIASASVEAGNADGIPTRQASSHPAEFSFSLKLGEGASGEPEEALRAVRVDLPPGFVGNPLAIPRCSRADFEGVVPRCSGNSQIGTVQVQLPGVSATEDPLYNLVPPPGFAASFGFSSLEFTGFEQASLRTGRDYGLSETVAPVSNGALQSISETIWGVPADPDHNPERVCYQSDGTKVEGCASNVQPAPFLTLPATCDGPVEIRVVAESIRGVVATKTASLFDSAGSPSVLTGCGEVPFKPQMQVAFASRAADSPTGTSIEVHLPQPDGPTTLAEAPLRSATIRFPHGLAINPSAAAGLEACTGAQIGLESPPGQVPGEFTPAPARCPDPAKVGSVEIDTPIVDHALRGAIYLAEPDQNPFAALIAVYMTVDDEESGVVLKLPAALEADPATGRLTLRLQDAPQIPVEDLRISLPSGPRALLRTPLSCGVAPIQGNFAPWSAPQKVVEQTGQLRIDVPAVGAANCPDDERDAPAAASFSAGTLIPAAGRSSPFLLKVGRNDGTRLLAGIEATLPPGLAAKLADVPTCTDAEVTATSCPAGSRVGSVDIAAGAGSLPLHLAGSVFLAGPYRGAPFSLQISTPVIAGPFDLGTLGVRVAMQMDPRTARIRVVSDALPMILEGIPLDIRSIAINLDRPGFIRNPTSCKETSIDGSVATALGRAVPISDRFQIGDCAALPFKPKLALGLSGGLGRQGHPALRAVLRTDPGGASVSRAGFTLPAGELLDLRHLRKLCPREAAADRCPAGSRLGSVRLVSPMLSTPLEGAIHLRVPSRRLPDLTAEVRSEGLRFLLRGRVTDRNGRLGIALDSLPDVPLSKTTLSLPGGHRGIVVNSRSLCAAGPATASFSAHSGKQRRLRVVPRLDGRC